ncbi:MAG: nucleotide sugar epimerase, partial [Patescibacteria group bacterium]
FIKYILSGKTISLYNKGDMYRSFTYIDDITAPMIKLLKSKHAPGCRVYNLGGAKSIQVWVLLRKLEVLLGKKAKIKFEKMHIADVKETNADITLIKKDVGFTPRVNIEDGLKLFVDWYLENKAWLSKLKEAKQ